MQIYINDGIWRQVINCTVIIAVVSSTGSLLAYISGQAIGQACGNAIIKQHSGHYG
ncbi:hypothetical protein [Loigolactobacillus jiayinensis]|uniref:Uncharacterized protein n=1 Tax=Loigolactobacillus jiayinensis TaxID=2486016 RepID=A0ABW1RFQ0_9LACO|nr:hypothetical protein [Loigolactobacillus jiayinensis]